MGDGDGVRGARDLDRAPGAGPLGHVAREGGGDGAVRLAELTRKMLSQQATTEEQDELQALLAVLLKT